MTTRDFDYIRDLLYSQGAVVLDEGKDYLVESRLLPLVREHQLDSLEELVHRLRSQPLNGLHTTVFEAMLTGESSFFRDHHPFEALRKSVLPELIERRRDERSLVIWCAACSTGQEPYSIALLIREHFPQLDSWDVRLIATDISGEALARARAGRFNRIEVSRGLPVQLLVKYFEQDKQDWVIKDDVRRMIEFRQMNLAVPWPPLPQADLVFLRNVMIYFDVPTKRAILQRVRSVLRPGGYLTLGGAESTLNLDDSFTRVWFERAGYYTVPPT